MTGVARTFGFYTGFAESIAMENVHKYVGSSWWHKPEMFQHTFLINIETIKILRRQL